ncbi:MAG: lauroyl acyltransferase [Rhodospirillales bacterium]|nr:lauroyl acyltransferase [Rhodospirillales bacterium]
MSLKTLRQHLEGAAAYLAFAFFQALPLDAASALGGWLARSLGPGLAVSRHARRNLARCFPEKSAAEIEAILRAVWDNLGRVTAEFPHLAEIGAERLEVVGGEEVERLRDDDRPGLIFSGHLGNWEALGLCAGRYRLPMGLVYRSANNPHVETLYRRGRGAVIGQYLPKGAAGARRAIEALRRREHLGLMLDQKMNDGIAVPFFGRPAMTAPALAQFALRFRCPVVPARVERLKGARFRVTFYPPLDLPDSGDRQADTLALMRTVNDRIEAWVRDRPGQWLWLHRRWPD